jgi:hypothetical protein
MDGPAFCGDDSRLVRTRILNRFSGLSEHLSGLVTIMTLPYAWTLILFLWPFFGDRATTAQRFAWKQESNDWL